MNKDVVIETERLILRQWNMDDIDDMVEGLNNINVTKWLAGAPFPYTIEDAKYFVQKTILENGYFKENEKSHKMQLKFGYKDEGIRRQKFVSKGSGKIEDEYITGLLKDEWIK